MLRNRVSFYLAAALRMCLTAALAAAFHRISGVFAVCFTAFFRRSSISCRVFADSAFAFELVRGYSPDRRRLTVSPPQFFSPQTAAAIVAAVIVAAASCSAARDASRSSHAVTFTAAAAAASRSRHSGLVICINNHENNKHNHSKKNAVHGCLECQAFPSQRLKTDKNKPNIKPSENKTAQMTLP